MVPVRSWRRRAGSSVRTLLSRLEGSCDGGRESGMCDADVAEELGKGGTGGRFRTGVEGVCVVELGSLAGVL